MRSVLAITALLVLALVPGVESSADEIHTVTASNFAWTPDDISVAVGDSVTFENGEGTHTWELSDGSQSCSLPCTKTFNTDALVEYRCGVHLSMTGVVRVGATPTVTIATPGAGATLTGTVVVQGTASHPSSDIESVSVQLADAPAVLATLTPIEGGAQWSASIPTANVMNGERALTVTATNAIGVAGSASVPVNVDNALSLDLAALSAGGAPAGITSNAIAFQVVNQGNGHATNVLVTADYFYDGEWRPIGSVTLPSVEYRATESGSIPWTTGTTIHAGAFEVRISVDPFGDLPDPARANNVKIGSAGWFTSAVPGVVVEL